MTERVRIKILFNACVGAGWLAVLTTTDTLFVCALAFCSHALATLALITQSVREIIKWGRTIRVAPPPITFSVAFDTKHSDA